MGALKHFGFILILLPTISVAQDLLLLPKWKKDDTRFLYFTETRTLPGAEGEAPVEVQDKSSAKLKVFDLDPQKAFLSIDHENVVVRVARTVFGRSLPPELDPYKRMIVRYEVDRQTGISKLINAEDLRQSTQKASEISVRAMRKADPEAAVELEKQLAPLVKQFSEQQLVEQYFDQRLGFLTRSFGRELEQGRPLTVEEVQADPIGSAGDSLTVTTTMTLESMDESTGQAVTRLTQALVAREKAAPAKKPAPATRTPSTPAEARARILQWEQEETTILDTRTTWPMRMSRSTSMRLSDGSPLRNRSWWK